MRKAFATPGFVLAALGLPLLLGTGSCQPPLHPIVFVHGGSGSGAQFESQAMRFTSNGYPRSFLAVVEYDSIALLNNDISFEDVDVEIDAKIAELQAELGIEQVDLIGHSLGTAVSQDYLSFPARAADVAHYVNIDGQTADSPPGGVPTLALTAGAVDRPAPRDIGGATNVTIPDQEHVQTATSEESFLEIYRFLRGKDPFTTKILPQFFPRIEGRVVQFPNNTGLDGATLEIWRVDGDTGERIGDEPKATFAIGPDGHFGPIKVAAGANHEFAVLRDGFPTIHTFTEPFIRSNHLMRINVADAIQPFVTEGPDHTVLSVVRFKEFWGDRGADNDVLSINGANVINATVAPSGAVGAAVAYFGFDTSPSATPPGPPDGISDLAFVPFPFGLAPFLTASDLFIPATPPGTVTIVTVPRGDLGAARTIHVRNIPATEDPEGGAVAVLLRDFEQ